MEESEVLTCLLPFVSPVYKLFAAVMGCASSKVLEHGEDAFPRFSRGISMPAHQRDRADDFHIVALTSSTYGILRLDPLDPTEEENKEGDPVKEMMRRLSNLESGGGVAPQSWHEVSSMVETLKPGLDKINSAKQPLPTVVGKVSGQVASQQPVKPDDMKTENIKEVKKDGIVQVSSKTNSSPEKTRKPKPFDKSLRIRTLEELDSRLERSVSVDTSALHSKKAEVVRSNSMQCSPSPPPRCDSGLFETGFWGSYKMALTNLSEDGCNSADGKEDSDHESQDSRRGRGSEDQIVVSPSRLAKQLFSTKSDVKLSEQSLPTDVTLPRPDPVKVVAQKTMSALEIFEEICPPGGTEAIVLYTTSLRGIRRTYENCNNIRGIVQSFGIPIDERDVSLHLEFRNELRGLMGKVVTAPRLFIKGRYIGGVEEVSKLHEEERLGELLAGLPKDGSTGGLCDGCGGSRFLPCFDCNGSCKRVDAGNSAQRCPECNENGLIQCPLCSKKATKHTILLL